MAKIAATLNHSNVKRPHKEMLKVWEENGKTVFSINFSSLDVINTCGRKAYYQLACGWKSKDESAPLVFGSSIHKALEVWYSARPEARILPKSKANDKGAIAANAGLELLDGGENEDGTKRKDFLADFRDNPEGIFAACMFEFGKSMRPLANLDAGDIRSVPSGVKILNNYFKSFKDDGLEVIVDAHGPLVERQMRAVMYEDDKIKIIFHGTCDLGVINPQSGKPVIMDHKTARSVGTDFFNRIKPNHQYTGYIWLAREVLGLDVRTFCVNGLQTAKTVHNVARQFTDRSDEDIAELKMAVIEACKRYKDWSDAGLWPMNSPQPCTMYGGCSFRRVCEVPQALRENILTSLFELPTEEEKNGKEKEESRKEEGDKKESCSQTEASVAKEKESDTEKKASSTEEVGGSEPKSSGAGGVKFKALS